MTVLLLLAGVGLAVSLSAWRGQRALARVVASWEAQS